MVPFCDGYALVGSAIENGTLRASAYRIGADGTFRWERTLTSGAVAFAAAPAGATELLVAASTVFMSGSSSVVLSRLDADGTGADSHAYGPGIAYDALAVPGGFVPVGATTDPTDRGFAAAVADDWTERWRLTFDPEIHAVARASDDGYALTGDGPTLAKLSAADATL